MSDNHTSQYTRIIGLYEEFQKHEGTLIAEHLEHLNFVAPSSLHSYVSKTAYGQALRKNCIRLSGGGTVTAKFSLLDLSSKRYYLKINLCLEQWQILFNDILITVNNRPIHYSEKEFIENICQGWPSIYFPVDQSFLRQGDNFVQIETEDLSKAGLLVSQVCFISLPEIVPYMQLSALRTVRVGQSFTIAVSVLGTGEVPTEVSCTPNYQYIHYSQTEIRKGICLLAFIAEGLGAASCKVKFPQKQKWLELMMPEVVGASEDHCLVGIDSDDHRHDLSDEANRIPEIFAMTAMGNFLQFRPSTGRTHLTFADEKIWEKRIHFLTDMEINIAIADTRSHLMGFVPKLAGSHYIGCHIHEPYLFFCLPLEKTKNKDVFMVDSKAVLASESFGESEVLYRNVLKKICEKNATKIGLNSVGSPSLLCVYEASENFDRITLEPVSNVNLLVGAARGTVITPKQWGAHIPVDWYFGTPNDICKSRKFRLALQYLYLSGAQYIYTENDVFKTNAFSREDWEDSFTQTNRQFLRDFYDYTIRHPRTGKLKVNKAVVYGRHEYFLWNHDDRMSELKDVGDWDLKVWGKWTDNHYQKCWRALDAWLPPASRQYVSENPSNLKLFSGSPYGSSNIISWDSDFSQYEIIAFLGLNVMTPLLLGKIKHYVYEGGVLFLSYCHFNMTDCKNQPPVFIDNDQLEQFLGIKIGEEFLAKGRIHFADGYEEMIEEQTSLKILSCIPIKAEMLAWDSSQKGIYFVNSFGKGIVYFGAFKEYFHERWAVKTAKHLMELLGALSGDFCDNPNICFTQRAQEDGSIIVDILNMNCAVENVKEKFKLQIGSQVIEDEIVEGKIYSYKLPCD